MITRILMVAAALVVIAALGYVIWLHPGVVEFQIARDQPLRMPLGWLLVFAFVAGSLIALAAASFQRLTRAIARSRVSRRDRAAGLIADWERTGLALSWDGEVDRARSLLLKAWRRAPHHPGAALALASSYMDTAEYEKARQILDEAHTQNPSDADVLYALSETLRRSGDHSEAIRMLEAIRVSHPRAPRALVGLRELYHETGRWREAAQVQEVYFDAAPHGQRAGLEQQRLLDLRYQVAMALPTPAQRIEALNEVLAVDRQHVPAIYGLADALVASGQEREAVRLLERSVRSIPCLLLAQRLFALQHTPRDRERVLASLRRIPELGADTVHYLAARAALGDGNFDAAAVELELVADREQPAVSRLWAEIHRQRGAVREALNALTRVAESPHSRDRGLPCRQCHRVPEQTGDTVPTCQYWDGIRRTGTVDTGA